MGGGSGRCTVDLSNFSLPSGQPGGRPGAFWCRRGPSGCPPAWWGCVPCLSGTPGALVVIRPHRLCLGRFVRPRRLGVGRHGGRQVRISCDRVASGRAGERFHATIEREAVFDPTYRMWEGALGCSDCASCVLSVCVFQRGCEIVQRPRLSLLFSAPRAHIRLSFTALLQSLSEYTYTSTRSRLVLGAQLSAQLEHTRSCSGHQRCSGARAGGEISA